MITLITGQPGAGKTLLLVSEFLTEAAKKNRPIIADGIPELKVEHSPAPLVKEWTTQVEDESSQDGKKLLFTFPEGSLVVIDECQRVFRPRGAGQRVPPEVAAFETHRHQGLDFILITQHPNLLDSNVRRLVGRHLHIRDIGILGRKVYEWPEAGNPDQFRHAPIQRKWSLPKKGFDLYKSSSLHVKTKRGIPFPVFVLLACIPIFIAVAIYSINSISSKRNPEATKTTEQKDLATTQPQNVQPQPSVDPADMIAEFSPRLSGRPETAPAYDALRVVKAMPLIDGCIKTVTRCVCLNQQGKDAGLDNFQCLAWIKNPPFDPYREMAQLVAPAGDGAGSVGAAQQTPPRTVTATQPQT